MQAQSFEEMKTLLQQTDDEKDRYPPPSLTTYTHILFNQFHFFLDCPTLRSELDKAVSMIGNYEQTREEKEMEIRHLQVPTHTVQLLLVYSYTRHTPYNYVIRYCK